MLDISNRALAYIRISTEDQLLGVSVALQIQAITNYCTNHQLIIGEIFVEKPISGAESVLRRPQLSLLIKLLRRNQAKHIVVYKIDRLSRDFFDLTDLVRLFQRKQIKMHTTDGEVKYLTNDGFLLFIITSLMADLERKRIVERTISALAYKKSIKQVVGTVPYGYYREGKDLIEIASEQLIIMRARTLYRKGHTLTEIVQLMEDTGDMARNGKRFNWTQIKRMIPNYIPVRSVSF